MVERGALEMRFRVKLNGGSNPPLSVKEAGVGEKGAERPRAFKYAPTRL